MNLDYHRLSILMCLILLSVLLHFIVIKDYCTIAGRAKPPLDAWPWLHQALMTTQLFMIGQIHRMTSSRYHMQYEVFMVATF